jgi:hypothetical protein
MTTRRMEKKEEKDSERFGEWMVEGLGLLYANQKDPVKRNVVNDIELFVRLIRRSFDEVIAQCANEREKLSGIEKWRVSVSEPSERGTLDQDERVLKGEQSSGSDVPTGSLGPGSTREDLDEE